MRLTIVCAALLLSGCALHPLRDDWFGHDCVRRACPKYDPCDDDYGPLGSPDVKHNRDCGVRK